VLATATHDTHLFLLSIYRIHDGAVNAVIANNMMTIQNTDDLFDAAKKMKMATGKEADAKLKQYQKRIISRNEALLQMFMNKVSRGIKFHCGIDWYLF
jgi:signal recognition particle subunit SRP72